MKSCTPILDRVRAMRALAEYKMYCLAIAKGVTWGEMAVFTMDEMMEMEVKPVVKKVKVAIDNRPLVKVSIDNRPLVKVSKLVATLNKLTRPKQVKQVNQENQKCMCCDFKVHPSPPSHFTVEQRAHCCGWCQVTNGREHGEHCMR
jgi:cephalosporin hydroxylase